MGNTLYCGTYLTKLKVIVLCLFTRGAKYINLDKVDTITAISKLDDSQLDESIHYLAYCSSVDNLPLSLTRVGRFNIIISKK